MMTDDPAPPGGVEQVGSGTGVLEVEERPDLAVVAHHDVDRGEITMNEHALFRGVRRGWMRSSLVGGIAVEARRSGVVRSRPIRSARWRARSGSPSQLAPVMPSIQGVSSHGPPGISTTMGGGTGRPARASRLIAG